MALDGLGEHLDGGSEVLDAQGRPIFAVVPKHQAVASTDTIRGVRPADPDGRPQIVLTSAYGNNIYPLAAAMASAYLLPSGGDDSAAVASALINFVPFASPDVVLGPGTFQWNSQVPGFLRSVPGKVRGAGEHATFVKLSASAPRAWDFARVDDYDTFDVEISDLTIDCNNVGGRHHVVLGTYIGGATQSRLNFGHIRVSRVRTINVPVDATGTNHRLNVWIVSNQAATGEGTQTIVQDVKIEDCQFGGGNQGVTIAGSCNASGTGLNVLVDDVHILGCRHTMFAAQTAPGIQSHFFIGSAAQGGLGTIQNCYGFGSGDVGVEIDAMTQGVIYNTTMEDCAQCFYHTNFNNPVDPDAQKITFDTCTAICKTRTDQRKGFYFARSNSVAIGEVVYRNCTSNKNANLIGVATSLNDTAFACGTGTVAKKVTLDGCTTINEGWTFTAGTSTAREILYSPGTSGSQPTTHIVVRDHRMRVNGTQSGGSLTLQGMAIGGAVDFKLDGMTVDWTIAGSPSVSGSLPIEFGQIAACTLSGYIRRLVVENINSGLASSPHVIQIRGTANLTIPKRFDIEKCDFSAMTDGTEVLFVSTGQNQAQTFFRENVWRTYPKPSAAMATSNFSAGTFTNAVGNQYIGCDPAEIHFANGTGAGITLIDVSKDGTTYENVYTQASGAMAQSVLVPVDNGDFVKVTFATTQPTTRVRPRR